MENRFAGAQQGNRRRRRLAGDDGDLLPDDTDLSVIDAPVPESVLHVGHVVPCVKLGVVSKIISRHLWKHLLFLTAVAALLIGMRNNVLAPMSVTLTSSATTPLSATVAGLLLLFAGQLTFAIGWIRSESEIDFRGRYRWWRWLAAATVGVALMMMTNTLALVPDLIVMVVQPVTGQLAAAKPAMVLVPSVAFSVVVVSRVLPDMGRSIGSQAVFTASVLTIVLRQMLIMTTAGDTIQPETLNLLLVVGAYLMFASMLLHCRFVAYICNDPPLAAAARSKTRDANADVADAATDGTARDKATDSAADKSLKDNTDGRDALGPDTATVEQPSAKPSTTPSADKKTADLQSTESGNAAEDSRSADSKSERKKSRRKARSGRRKAA